MNKSIQKNFRFDETTANVLSRKSEKLKLSESEYLRQLIMSDSEVKAYLLLKEDISKIMIEIIRIGNNINQIAHAANLMYVTKEDFKAMREFENKLFWLRGDLQNVLFDMKNGKFDFDECYEQLKKKNRKIENLSRTC